MLESLEKTHLCSEVGLFNGSAFFVFSSFGWPLVAKNLSNKFNRDNFSSNLTTSHRKWWLVLPTFRHCLPPNIHTHIHINILPTKSLIYHWETFNAFGTMRFNIVFVLACGWHCNIYLIMVSLARSGFVSLVKESSGEREKERMKSFPQNHKRISFWGSFFIIYPWCCTFVHLKYRLCQFIMEYICDDG